MTKLRQDAWSHEDDLLLAETVLRHIRDGSTQLNAFDEVGDILNRTSAACGFRWNAEVRNQYIDAIELAKKQRKEKKRQQAANINKVSTRKRNYIENNELPTENMNQTNIQITMEDVIGFLQNYEEQSPEIFTLKQQLNKMTEKNHLLQEKLMNTENALSKTMKKLSIVEEDYQTFIQIMDRARKLTVLEDEETQTIPSFKMDKNGNLQQIVHKTN